MGCAGEEQATEKAKARPATSGAEKEDEGNPAEKGERGLLEPWNMGT